MAFHLTNNGFRMSLSAYVPKLLAAKVEEFVDLLLRRNGLTRADVRHWVCIRAAAGFWIMCRSV